MKTIAIGDIHGGLKALIQLVEKLELQADDKLIFLGDYVDGWSESAEVISYLMELDQQYRCIFIKGNHDAWCQSWLETGTADRGWLFHGGASTYESYMRHDEKMRPEHLTFFERMRDYYVDSSNRLFIHAGFTSMHGPEKEHYDTNYSWDRTLWEVALAKHHSPLKDPKYYPVRLTLFSEIYIGHTPTTKYDELEPMQACNVWNVDTGAAFKGSLSAIDINTKQVYQSEPVYSLYPREKGRNRD